MTRDDLIDNARYGRMTSEQAEAEAARLNLGPLARKPSDDAFDPMGEAWWTLAMTVAWIVWRSPRLVRAYWSAFRSECWDWHQHDWRVGPDGPVHAGYFLEQRRLPNLAGLHIHETYDAVHGSTPVALISVVQAEKELWDALREGLLEGIGADISSGQRSVIPAIRWRELKAVVERDRDVLRPTRKGSTAHAGYDEVEFRRQAVMRLWPPHRRDALDPQLAPPTAPEGPGYMPLFCAAHWIATRGHTIAAAELEAGDWENAYGALLAALSSERVKAVGMREGRSDPIPGFNFAACRIDYMWMGNLDGGDDLHLGDEVYLRTCPYIDDEHWRGGFDDALTSRRGDLWSRILVLKSDVAAMWPFEQSPSSAKDDIALTRTGAPGRPSSMHLIEAEHAARWDRGEAKTSVAEEAHALNAWFKHAYPYLPAPTPNTIENRIRPEHRQRKAEARN